MPAKFVTVLGRFLHNSSILVGDDSITVLKKKKVTDQYSLIDFKLEFSHKLIWNEQKEAFERQKNQEIVVVSS